MNGPKHYKEAEQLLGAASKPYFGDNPGSPEEMALLATAQVHATLALAAAVAIASAPEMPIPDCEGWRDAAETPKRGAK